MLLHKFQCRSVPETLEMERETKHMLPHFEKEKSIVYVNYFTCSFMKNSFNYSEFIKKKKKVLHKQLHVWVYGWFGAQYY